MSVLKEALLRFDGVHTAPLREAQGLVGDNIAELVELCAIEDCAVAATWVVKAMLEAGARVDLAQVVATLERQSDWAAQLHILQSVRFKPKAAEPYVSQICALLDAQKTLVRVWALDALVRVADVAPKWRDEARARVADALAAKAASLRARARDLKGICAGW